jgi:hypothetical protein
MNQLTAAQTTALATIKAEGILYSGNGVSWNTVAALHRRGLVDVTGEVQTWYSRRSGRNLSQLDWAATAR